MSPGHGIKLRILTVGSVLLTLGGGPWRGGERETETMGGEECRGS